MTAEHEDHGNTPAAWIGVIIIMLACVVGAGLLVACRRSAPIETRGDAGDAGVQGTRVASLSPAVTEKVMAV